MRVERLAAAHWSLFLLRFPYLIWKWKVRVNTPPHTGTRKSSKLVGPPKEMSAAQRATGVGRSLGIIGAFIEHFWNSAA